MHDNRDKSIKQPHAGKRVEKVTLCRIIVSWSVLEDADECSCRAADHLHTNEPQLLNVPLTD